MLHRHVVIADTHNVFARNLAAELCCMGWDTQVVDDADSAISSALQSAPSLVLSERKVGSRGWREILESLRAAGVDIPFVIVTAYGSIADAVTATRLGVAGYLTKPTTAANVLEAVSATGKSSIEAEASAAARARYLSLERAKWEYIHMTLQTSGSLAEAARRLRVERRSLRRMLTKHPPPS